MISCQFPQSTPLFGPRERSALADITETGEHRELRRSLGIGYNGQRRARAFHKPAVGRGARSEKTARESLLRCFAPALMHSLHQRHSGVRRSSKVGYYCK